MKTRIIEMRCRSLKKCPLTFVILALITVLVIAWFKPMEISLTKAKLSHLWSKNKETVTKIPAISVNYQLHALYYAWYGNPQKDGKFLHWDRQYEQHWDESESGMWPSGLHNPPNDIAASFYPELGVYSSMDQNVLDTHMQQFVQAGIGTLVLTLEYFPENYKEIEELMPVFDIAHKHKLKVTFQIPDYQDRHIITIRATVEKVFEVFKAHPAFYIHNKRGKKMPLFYVYDSYKIPTEEWRKLLSKGDLTSIRETKFDSYFIGLVTDNPMKVFDGMFDGYYTYFANEGFTIGSTWGHWKSLRKFSSMYDLIFIPTIAPGYNDTGIRPWNFDQIRDRQNGSYYEKSFKYASKNKPDIICINSFNEWHEGTQIEPASPKKLKDTSSYSSYEPLSHDFYLKLTKRFSNRF